MGGKSATGYALRRFPAHRYKADNSFATKPDISIYSRQPVMPLAALHELVGVAGLAAPSAGQVRISGADPVIPTPYRIGAAGAASLAAIGLAASELWQLRTGRSQQVAVDVRAAAASLRSARHLKPAVQMSETPARWARPPVPLGHHPARWPDA